MKELSDKGNSRLDVLKRNHEKKKKELQDEITKLGNRLVDLKDRNKKEEEKMRGDFNKADRNYHDIL